MQAISDVHVFCSTCEKRIKEALRRLFDCQRAVYESTHLIIIWPCLFFLELVLVGICAMLALTLAGGMSNCSGLVVVSGGRVVVVCSITIIFLVTGGNGVVVVVVVVGAGVVVVVASMRSIIFEPFPSTADSYRSIITFDCVETSGSMVLFDGGDCVVTGVLSVLFGVVAIITGSTNVSLFENTHGILNDIIRITRSVSRFMVLFEAIVTHLINFLYTFN